MNKTTENLISALKEYKPPKTVTVIYRLVYDVDTGKPICITTEPTDQPYIEISQEDASAQPHLDPRVRVENNKIIRQVKSLIHKEEPNKLRVKQDSSGNIVTDDYNMLIINNNGTNKWKI